MPKGLANLMTRAEFLDLVRFLSELGKPGPYAIRPVPAIQRWKVLKAVPNDLANPVPSERCFRDQVLGAEPEQWDVAYAKVDGSLPLDEADLQKRRQGRLSCRVRSTFRRPGPVKCEVDSAAGRSTLDRRDARFRLGTVALDRPACGRPAFDHGSSRYGRPAITDDHG